VRRVPKGRLWAQPGWETGSVPPAPRLCSPALICGSVPWLPAPRTAQCPLYSPVRDPAPRNQIPARAAALPPHSAQLSAGSLPHSGALTLKPTDAISLTQCSNTIYISWAKNPWEAMFSLLANLEMASILENTILMRAYWLWHTSYNFIPVNLRWLMSTRDLPVQRFCGQFTRIL